METVSLLVMVIILVSLPLPFLKPFSACYTIIVTNMLVFFLIMGAHSIQAGTLQPFPSGGVVRDLGYVNGDLTAAPFTLLTALYIHGGIIHLIMNVLFLALLGGPFEDRIGKERFLVIYLLSGVGGSIIFGLTQSGVHGIGASGAIFGVMGAFAAKYPNDEIPFLLVFIFLPRVPVFFAFIIYGGMETAYAASGIQDGVGHFAHLGGLISGVVAAQILVKDQKARQYFDSIIFKTIADETGKEELMKIGEEIEKADEKDVRNAWIEEFFEKVSCPSCGNTSLKMSRTGIGCQCGYLRKFSEFKVQEKEKRARFEKEEAEDEFS